MCRRASIDCQDFSLCISNKIEYKKYALSLYSYYGSWIITQMEHIEKVRSKGPNPLGDSEMANWRLESASNWSQGLLNIGGRSASRPAITVARQSLASCSINRLYLEGHWR